MLVCKFNVKFVRAVCFQLHHAALLAFIVDHQYGSVGDCVVDARSIILGRHLPVHRSANGQVSFYSGFRAAMRKWPEGFKSCKNAPKHPYQILQAMLRG